MTIDTGIQRNIIPAGGIMESVLNSGGVWRRECGARFRKIAVAWQPKQFQLKQTSCEIWRFELPRPAHRKMNRTIEIVFALLL